MARLGTFCGWWRRISRTGAVSVVSKLVDGPAICLCSAWLFHLLLVTLRGSALYAISRRLDMLSLLALSLARPKVVHLDVGVAVDADVLHFLGQFRLVVLRIVARLMLPPIAPVARDCPTIVV